MLDNMSAKWLLSMVIMSTMFIPTFIISYRLERLARSPFVIPMPYYFIAYIVLFTLYFFPGPLAVIIPWYSQVIITVTTFAGAVIMYNLLRNPNARPLRASRR